MPSDDDPTKKELLENDPEENFDPPELNCSVVFSLYCVAVSKNINHFLRDLVRGEREDPPGSVSIHFLSLIGMMLGKSTGSSLWFCHRF